MKLRYGLFLTANRRQLARMLSKKSVIKRVHVGWSAIPAEGSPEKCIRSLYRLFSQAVKAQTFLHGLTVFVYLTIEFMVAIAWVRRSKRQVSGALELFRELLQVQLPIHLFGCGSTRTYVVSAVATRVSASSNTSTAAIITRRPLRTILARAVITPERTGRR